MNIKNISRKGHTCQTLKKRRSTGLNRKTTIQAGKRPVFAKASPDKQVVIKILIRSHMRGNTRSQYENRVIYFRP
jgi:hypothetical protein